MPDLVAAGGYAGAACQDFGAFSCSAIPGAQRTVKSAGGTVGDASVRGRVSSETAVRSG